MQLVQIQVLGARLITREFRATSMQVLNIEAYLTPIALGLDWKTDQIAARLYSRPLYQMLTQRRSIYFRQLPSSLKTLEKRHITLFSNNIHKLKRRPTCIVPLWQESLAVNILNLKKNAKQFPNEYLVYKPSAKVVAYTNESGINKKIGFSCIIQEKTKAIKTFLRANIFSTVYIRELQGIEDSFSYTLSKDYSSGIQIFMDIQTTL